MPKFSVEMTVVRTIVQCQPVTLEIEADDRDAAEDQASTLAEKSTYHDLDDKNWDLESIDSEGQDIEATPMESDEDE